MATTNRLAYLAFGLVFVSAAIHLALGVAGLSEAAAGDESAVLPALYTLAGIVALALIGGYLGGRLPATTSYALGAVLMVLLLFMYADWHAFGSVQSALGMDAHGGGHHHGGPATVIVEHLRDDAVALVAKTAEVIAAATFVALYATDR